MDSLVISHISLRRLRILVFALAALGMTAVAALGQDAQAGKRLEAPRPAGDQSPPESRDTGVSGSSVSESAKTPSAATPPANATPPPDAAARTYNFHVSINDKRSDANPVTLLHIVWFFREWVFAAAVIAMFGVCGAGFISPFLARFRFGILFAPFAGMLLVSFGAMAFYAILQAPFGRGALLSVICCVLYSLLHTRTILRDIQSVRFSVLAILATAALLVLLVDSATLFAAQPALGYGDGTDQSGYSHLADWIRTYPVLHRPELSSTAPYENLPARLFANDPRFGCFGLLALLSLLHGTSGLFTFDIVCAIALTCGTLAVAAAFAKNRVVFVILLIGLITSHWFDYCRCGYFGKTIAYPGALLLARLAVECFAEEHQERLFSLMLLASALAVAHSGGGTSLLVAGILGVAALATLATIPTGKAAFRNISIVCGVAVLVPPIASGVIARPRNIHFPDWGVSWSYAFPRTLDLDNQGVNITGLEPSILHVLAGGAVILWALALALAVKKRAPLAIGMIGGPALILGVLALSPSTATAFQMLGYFYPAMLCGIAAMIETVSAKTTGVMAMLLLSIGLRQPRFAGDIHRYVTIGNSASRYTRSEMDKLAKKIGEDTVEIDVKEPQAALALLVELGPRKLHLVWSERSWETVLRHRDLNPVHPAGATKLITLSEKSSMGRHFILTPIEAPAAATEEAPAKPPALNAP